MPTPIDHDELAARLTAGTIALLDAQAPGWYEREHLPGAHRLDWDDLPGSARTAVPDPATPVAVYCWNTTCTGSEIAAAELERLGYEAVHRYHGGKQDWTEHGGAIVEPGNQDAGQVTPSTEAAANPSVIGQMVSVEATTVT